MAARPIRLVDPFITLGGDPLATPTPILPTDFQCFAAGIHLTGEADDELATFCDPEGFAYTLSLDLKMSLGTESLDEALTLLGVGNVVPFEFAYTGDPASADNPHWSGKVRIPAYPIVDAGINEPTSFTIDMPVIGEVARDNGGTVVILGAAPRHSHTTPTTDTQLVNA